MSFFKKIFGGTETKDETRKVENSIREIENSPKPEVYPILKDYNWVAKPFAAHINFKGIDKPPVPLVAFGYNTTDNFIFVTKDKLAEKPLDQLEAEAMENIRNYEAKWEMVQDFMLTASGEDFSAEKILCEDFIREAGRLLNTEKILVAIPRRTCISAISANASQEDLQKFFYLAKVTLQDDSYGNAFITNLVFEFTNAELTGAMVVEMNEN
jgi:hypothetical protein